MNLLTVNHQALRIVVACEHMFIMNGLATINHQQLVVCPLIDDTIQPTERTGFCPSAAKCSIEFLRLGEKEHKVFTTAHVKVYLLLHHISKAATQTALDQQSKIIARYEYKAVPPTISWFVKPCIVSTYFNFAVGFIITILSYGL